MSHQVGLGLELSNLKDLPTLSGPGQSVIIKMRDGRIEMQITYDVRTDVLYLRMDSQMQDVVNKRITDEIVLDMGEDDKIVGIEILDASQHINLSQLLPVEQTVRPYTHPQSLIPNL
jgi:uncharacterized protein YuzE